MAKGFGNTIKGIKDIEKNLEAIARIKSSTSNIRMSIRFEIDNLNELKSSIKKIEKIPGRVAEAHARTMEIVASKLKEALDDAMNSNSWQWINDTRDIIDTTALRESGRVTYNKTTQQLSITYGLEYAAIVHFGGYIKSGYNPDVQIFYPARPWIESVFKGTNGIQKFPFAAIYREEFKKFTK